MRSADTGCWPPACHDWRTMKKRFLAIVLIVVSAPIFGIALVVIRSIRLVKIKSAGMMNTLRVGDHLAVYRGAPGIARGDIVLFRCPTDTDTSCIARVVGLPGELIYVPENRVVINGEELAERRVVATDAGQLEGLRELSAEGTGPYSVYYSRPADINAPPPLAEDEYAVRSGYKIPWGAYFVLGDNRNNSEDSRYYGAIKGDQMTGRLLGDLSSLGR